MLKIDHFVAGPLGNNCFILADEASREALLVDAPLESPAHGKALAARGLKFKGIVITHGHFDHTAEAAFWAETLAAPVLIHPADGEWAESGPEHSRMFGMRVPKFPHWEKLADGQIIALGTTEIRVLHTPGHTQGGVCLYVENDGAGGSHLFTGDTLFAGSIGRTDLPGGDTEQLLASIKSRLLPLPAATRVYPGHGEFSTLGEERDHNPFLSPNGGYSQIGIR